MHILITAGPTVEDIDPVRFISNRSTGKLGFALAQAALQAKHQVTLIHGPVDSALITGLPHGKPLKRIEIRSSDEMFSAVMNAVGFADAVIMNAAVADFQPKRSSVDKLKKSATLTLELRATADILKHLGDHKRDAKERLILVGFALETGEGETPPERSRTAIEFARRKMKTKNLDAIVLNSPDTIGSDEGDFLILFSDPEKPSELAPGAKDKFARHLIDIVQKLARR